MEDHDHHMPDLNRVDVNGTTSKRKSRGSLVKASYAEEHTSDEDDQPLVHLNSFAFAQVEFAAATSSSKYQLTVVQNKRRRTSTGKMGTAVSSDSDDQPLLAVSKLKRPPRASDAQIGEESDSDAPIEQKLAAEKDKIQQTAAKEAVAIRKEERKAGTAPAKRKSKVKEEDDGMHPTTSRKKSQVKPPTSKKVNGVNKEESSDDDMPLSKKAGPSKASKKVKAEIATPSKKAAKGKAVKKEESADAEEDEEEEYRWWEDPSKGDGTKKWDTLQHQGVIFPPPYELLPKNVKMLYDGKPISMHPDAEEVATFFGSMLNSANNVENPVFQQNFFKGFQDILKKTGGAKDKSGEKVPIKEFSACDFKPVYEYYAEQREAKKALPAAEKKKLKAEKDAIEAPFMFCTWDGRKQKVGNFRIEPPGLFRGRGEHPKTGTIKTRVLPEQITINIGKEAKVPPPPEGHKWKEIRHDKEGTWLAMWQENVNGNYKYVMLAANSDVKGQSDYKKFEKARELKKHIDRIRADYRKGLKASLTQDRQKATAVYLIDQFALRAGNEKGEDEADTVGCCSLKFEHVTLREPDTVIFDFLGKDSIRFYDEVKVDPQVFKNLKLFKKAPKEEGDEIFDRLTTSALNKHLSNYMTGLTAKVFRTYNASYTMSTLLRDMTSTGTTNEKIKDYNDANRKVAILCNHKRTVAAGHAGQMEKLSERIKGVRYQQWRIKQMMLDIDPKIKKKKGAEYFALPDDLDEDWIRQHQAYLVDDQKTKITNKFEKDNVKLKAEGEKEMKVKELEEKLEPAKELEKKFKKENKSKKVEAEGKGPTIEKMEAKLTQLDQRLANMSLQAEDKENNKEVALGTSKIVSQLWPGQSLSV